jgi:predicted site-specific integrase-resolvase
MDKLTLSVAEAASMLGISLAKAYEQVRVGRLAPVQQNGFRRGSRFIADNQFRCRRYLAIEYRSS